MVDYTHCSNDLTSRVFGNVQISMSTQLDLHNVFFSWISTDKSSDMSEIPSPFFPLFGLEMLSASSLLKKPLENVFFPRCELRVCLHAGISLNRMQIKPELSAIIKEKLTINHFSIV